MIDFIDRMRMCIEEFNYFLNSNDYISKKEYDLFADKYRDVFEYISKNHEVDNTDYVQIVGIAQNGYKIIEEKNNKYIEKELHDCKDYFDELFLQYDPNILLDDEQRKAIVIDEDYSLVIAGAGSGKTTTIVAKVKYLIDKKGIKPNEVLLLAFNNKVRDELDLILNDYFKLNVEVLTFHKLGMKFIRGIFDKPVQILNESKVRNVFSDYFISFVFKNKKVLSYYLKYFASNLSVMSQNSDWTNYESYDDYYKHYMDSEYLTYKDNLDSEISIRTFKRMKWLRTINGEFVKSKGEVEIANYLFKHGIPYKYEARYPYFVGDLRSYSPDFTINLNDQVIYIEYFGLASINQNGFRDSIDASYLNEIYLKKNVHEKNNTDLIELYGDYEDESHFLKHLAYELTKRNIRIVKKDSKDIFYRLMETSKESLYISLIYLFSNFILTFKDLNFEESKFNELIRNAQDDTIKGQLILLKNVYLYYNKTIHDDYCIDFPDMINYAYRYMGIAKNNSRLHYKYVFVDEYQDISQSRFHLIKKLSDLFNAKVVAVGDDWQTIYSFSGSDIQLFTHFLELMGYGEVIKITKTYRNSQELIDVAGEFILQNEFQIEKKLSSDKHLENPIQLVNYNEELDGEVIKTNFALVVEKLICFLYERNPKNKILLLGRFNDDFNSLLESKRFFYKNKKEGRIICNACPLADLTFLTVHRSKGLGFDQVIILNGINARKGFPSKIPDPELIKLLKASSKISNTEEFILYPEERRLFYVAITRTKEFVFIMVPNLNERKSEFVKEISNYENVGSL